MGIPVDNETGAPQQAARHPLDPLMAGEVEETTRVLSASGRITARGVLSQFLGWCNTTLSREKEH